MLSNENCKTISFNVPVSFNLPVQYFELNTEETANILGILPTIYNLLKQETNKTIPEESKKLISQIKRTLEEQENSKNNYYIEENNQLKHRLIEIETNFNSLVNKVLEKDEIKSPQEQPAVVGGKFEKNFETMIRACSSTHTWLVEDTSHSASLCDRLCVDETGFRLMVEIKGGCCNMLHSKNDVQKFENNVYDAFSEGYSDAAMFLNMRTPSIPKRGPIHLEYVKGNPVLWLSSTEPSVIMSSIVILRSIAKYKISDGSGVQNSEDADKNVLKQKLPGVASYLWNSQERILTMEKHANSIIQCISRDKQNLRQAIFDCESLFEQLSFINGTNVCAVKDMIHSLSVIYEEKGRDAKKSEVPFEVKKRIEKSCFTFEELKKMAAETLNKKRKLHQTETTPKNREQWMRVL